MVEWQKQTHLLNQSTPASLLGDLLQQGQGRLATGLGICSPQPCPAVEMHNSQVVHAQHMSHLGCYGEAIQGLPLTGLHPPAIQVHHPHVEPGLCRPLPSNMAFFIACQSGTNLVVDTMSRLTTLNTKLMADHTQSQTQVKEQNGSKAAHGSDHMWQMFDTATLSVQSH